MWNMLWPILVIVGANTLYHICEKAAPGEINAFATLSVTYLVAAVTSLFLFFLTSDTKNLWTELAKTNWTSYALGISIVGLEFGFLFLYRVGWKVSIGNLVASITLSCVLLIIGLLFFKETLNLRQWIGVGVSALGIILITK